jgi:hypothetical protein
MSDQTTFWCWIAVLAVTCLFLGAVLASVVPALNGAEDAPGRCAVDPTQTCSRASTCATETRDRSLPLP